MLVHMPRMLWDIVMTLSTMPLMEILMHTGILIEGKKELYKHRIRT